MVDIETKSPLATLGAPESLMGFLLLAGALLLFRFTWSEPNLRHIPLLDADLSRAERWKAHEQNEKDVYARGYKKVFICVLSFLSITLKQISSILYFESTRQMVGDNHCHALLLFTSFLPTGRNSHHVQP